MARNPEREALTRIRSCVKKLSPNTKSELVAELMDGIGLNMYASALREAMTEEQNENPFRDY